MITIQDVRRAISYVNMAGTHIDILRDVSDEQLLTKDFTKDLNMGNIRVANVLKELEHIHNNLCIPMGVLQMMPDNTIGAFITTINTYLNEKTNT